MNYITNHDRLLYKIKKKKEKKKVDISLSDYGKVQL